MIPAIAPPVARALAVAAVDAVGADLAGVDLLPTGDGWIVLEVNGAVDFRPLYACGTDVYADAIAALLDAIDQRRPALAAVSGETR